MRYDLDCFEQTGPESAKLGGSMILEKKIFSNGTPHAHNDFNVGRPPGPTSININKPKSTYNKNEKHDLRHHEVGTRPGRLREPERFRRNCRPKR